MFDRNKIFSEKTVLHSIGILSFGLSLLCIVLMCLNAPDLIKQMLYEAQTIQSHTSSVIFAIKSLSELAIVIGALVLGIRLLRSKRRNAAIQCYILVAHIAVSMLCQIMLYGASFSNILQIASLVILLAFSTYLDPNLQEERRVQRSLYDLEAKSEAELGEMQGRDLSGEGYIALNFFNAFWIFLICSFLGLCLELGYQYALHGTYMSRAGMLFGPFSPIYGFGGLLLTMVLNKQYRKNPLVIFLISALVGGGFEYFVSFFLEYTFGIVAWDYSDDFLNINGRTNAYYMVLWGLLGLVWIKLLLPYILKLINKINWRWRYTLTTVAFIAMLINGAMTLMSFDFWYERQSGSEPQTAVEIFFSRHFGDEYMAERFETMQVHGKPNSRIS